MGYRGTDDRDDDGGDATTPLNAITLKGIPEADAARFHAFTKCFDVGAKTQEIATLLKEDPVVTKIHTQLVRFGCVFFSSIHSRHYGNGPWVVA